MEQPSRLLAQTTYNTRPKKEEHMLIVMDKSTHEEYPSQPLQTNKKQFKIAVTFLTAYNGIFNVTNSNNKFYFKKAIKDEDSIRTFLSPGAYEIESLEKEIKRIIIEKGHYTKSDYPFRIKPNFQTLGSIVEILTPGPMISFAVDDGVGILLGFNEILLWANYNLSPIPVDILSFDYIFIHTDIARGLIFKNKRNDIIHNFSMDIDPGYNYIEKFRGGFQWYMMDSKDVISNTNFKLKNEIGKLVSFNGQSVTFRLSIKEI